MCHDNARTGLEDSVVLYELRERYRLVVVDLHRCIEDTLVRLEVGPVVRVRVAVDMPVDHKRPHAVVEGHHRVVAERDRMLSVARLQHCVNTLEVAGEIDLVRPRRVVIAENESLASLETFEHPFRILGAEEEVSYDEHPVGILDLGVPS